uniref:Uncharacterized protein n=1 Tax=Anguilla anguilla TaxID=7936 RepID=A0A0E9VUD8_ANGAN
MLCFGRLFHNQTSAFCFSLETGWKQNPEKQRPFKLKHTSLRKTQMR